MFPYNAATTWEIGWDTWDFRGGWSHGPVQTPASDCRIHSALHTRAPLPADDPRDRARGRHIFDLGRELQPEHLRARGLDRARPRGFAWDQVGRRGGAGIRYALDGEHSAPGAHRRRRADTGSLIRFPGDGRGNYRADARSVAWGHDGHLRAPGARHVDGRRDDRRRRHRGDQAPADGAERRTGRRVAPR